jgi:hypothetical protein
MTNLEELDLLFLSTGNRIIDGNVLKQNFINHMPTLNKFTFNIGSLFHFNDQFDLPSNQYIKSTFKDFNNTIISSINYFAKSNLLYCHVYSSPYTWKFYHYVTNDFPGGLFKCVRIISLRDERPFEHNFFLQIGQSFPFIKKIIVHNYEPQQDEHLQWEAIKYHHLTEIDLVATHEDYVDQFLNNTKMYLFNNVHLRICYDLLKKKTNNFTRDATRMNCSKITGLTLSGNMRNSDENFKKYFPHAKIYRAC